MLAGSTFARRLRQAAPTLSRRFFAANCPHLRCHRPLLRQPTNPPRSSPSGVYCTAFDYQKRYFWGTIQRTTTASVGQDAKSAELQRAASSQIRKGSRFPESSSNTVAYWLLASAASVFGIVVFGGWTRLTESGLSITEWKPVTGSLPPLSEVDWSSEFLKYQSSPEFHLLNSRMTLEEFKSIYWMEWIHRQWGRAVGLTFLLPAVYFILRGRVSKPMSWRLGGIASLIGFQGFIGWWMVKSGLKDDLFAPGSHPRVSQYRLTAHLGTAFLCYVAMLWNGLTILHTNHILSKPHPEITRHVAALANPRLKPFKMSLLLLTGLIFTTAMSGALVAGLDAGLIYNEFPYMGLGLSPPKSELFDPFYSRTQPPHPDLVWRNMLENPSLVQLDHRILATSTFSAVMAFWAYSSSSRLKLLLPPLAKRGVHGLVGFVWMQVILGISTLIYLVPISLASAHQAGSLALLSMAVVLLRRCWVPSPAMKILQRRGVLGFPASGAMAGREVGTLQCSTGNLSGPSGMTNPLDQTQKRMFNRPSKEQWRLSKSPDARIR